MFDWFYDVKYKMKRFKYLNICLIFLLFSLTKEGTVVAQIDTQATQYKVPESFLHHAAVKHKGRTRLISASSVGIYTLSMIGLNSLWYSEYERSSFQFFNDNNEWLQMDKMGHALTNYHQFLSLKNCYRWAGVTHEKAVWISAGMSFGFQLGIEVLDGFSEKWGASWGDVLANGLGMGVGVGQELVWQEQRFRLKFSTHRVNYEQLYGNDLATQRAANLYGTSFSQLWLKDYNGQTYWLSFNPFVVANKSSKLPEWLCFSFGYSVDGLLGGKRNIWESEAGALMDLSEIARNRNYLFSVDIDFSRINTSSKLLKAFLKGINLLKVPAPALQVNNRGKLRFYPLYF